LQQFEGILYGNGGSGGVSDLGIGSGCIGAIDKW
jgi:hypothetical protein